MNLPGDNQQDLQRQLDEAGRICRPRHPGWETLLERLPPQVPAEDAQAAIGRKPTDRRTFRKPARWKTAAIAAAILIAIVLVWSLLPGPDRPAQAESLPIEVERRGIQVTIFSATESREQTLFAANNVDLAPRFVSDMNVIRSLRNVSDWLDNSWAPYVQTTAGVNIATEIGTWRSTPRQALVKDQRMVLRLKRGDNVVKFTDVAATIDPTSVRLVSDTDPLGTKVVEQNFEFDLANADALLKRSLEHKVTCIGQDGQEVYEGYLLSYDSKNIVLVETKPSEDAQAGRPKTQTVARRKLQAIRLDRMPSDLYTRPTLVWKLRTDKPGDHLTTLTYLCGDVAWQADYVALITQSSAEQDTLDLGAWVTIDNRSGTIYENAGLKLIAGDVSRVRDPWAPPPPSRQSVQPGPVATAVHPAYWSVHPMTGGSKRSFSEYKLYTLSQPSTIKDHQIKQLGLFKASAVKARRRYVCRSEEGDRLHPVVQLLAGNNHENNLGRPLPKGRVTLMAVDADGEHQFLGRDEIDHTAKDEELEINVGRAFDVVYDYRVLETERPAKDRMIQTYEFCVRNHKPADIQIRAVAQLPVEKKVWARIESPEDRGRGVGILVKAKDWTVVRASDPFTKHDYKTLHFDFQLKPNSEKTITYTVDYWW